MFILDRPSIHRSRNFSRSPSLFREFERRRLRLLLWANILLSCMREIECCRLGATEKGKKENRVPETSLSETTSDRRIEDVKASMSSPSRSRQEPKEEHYEKKNPFTDPEAFLRRHALHKAEEDLFAFSEQPLPSSFLLLFPPPLYAPFFCFSHCCTQEEKKDFC